MKNKGFTLIELLAVIVILALIALVTIPMINNVIEKAKKGALEDSVYGLKSAAELYYSTTGTSETIEFNCNENGCINGDKKLPFKGSVEDGKVKLFSDGKVSICLTGDGYGSSILAGEKKATTKMGGCDEETYKVSEVIAIEKYDELNEENKEIKNALYNKTLITSKELSKDNIVAEINNIDLNESEAENKKGIVDALQYSGLGITEDMSWEEIDNILSSAYPQVKQLVGNVTSSDFTITTSVTINSSALIPTISSTSTGVRFATGTTGGTDTANSSAVIFQHRDGFVTGKNGGILDIAGSAVATYGWLYESVYIDIKKDNGSWVTIYSYNSDYSDGTDSGNYPKPISISKTLDSNSTYYLRYRFGKNRNNGARVFYIELSKLNFTQLN